MAVAAAAITDKVGFWRRVAAYIIDVIVLAIVGGVITGAVYGGNAAAASGLNFVIGLVYFIGLWAYWSGQTIGNKIMGIRVVKTDGTPLTLVASIVRYVGLIISFIVIFIGVIWVAFDPNKQGWHDKIASTYVVRA